MTDITQPQVKKFTNETGRQTSDMWVRLIAIIDAETVTWTETIEPMLAGYADDDVVPLDHDQDGRTQLSKSDLVDYVAELAAFKVWVNASPGRRATLSKPHVNGLRGL